MTASTITVGVVVIDVAGANSIIGVPDAATQEAEDNAYISSINTGGGIDCRKLVAKYYTDNPLDANSEHSTCLQILSDKVFAVIGDLYTAQNQTCLPQYQVPVFSLTAVATTLLEQFYPYIFGAGSSKYIFNDYVLGAKRVGYFDGLGRLGVLTETCFPDYTPEMMAALSRAAIPSSQIETFSFGCPTGNAPDPASVGQAVLQFHQDGVTHVMSAGAPMAQFSSQAQTQGYKPHYATGDMDETMQLNPGTGFSVNPQNFDGALTITTQQYGALGSKTPVSAETAHCDAIMQKGGAPTAESGDAYAGGVCMQFSFFLNATTREGPLTRAGLVGGLDKTGAVDMSYPFGPAVWSGAGVTWGGQFWRTVGYSAACSCFGVTDPTWRPGF